MSITVQNVSKRFGSFAALNNVSVEAESGSLLALLGPSGSGKTTLLRIIAGLETADAGVVLYRDEEVTNTPARGPRAGAGRRRVARGSVSQALPGGSGSAGR